MAQQFRPRAEDDDIRDQANDWLDRGQQQIAAQEDTSTSTRQQQWNLNEEKRRAYEEQVRAAEQRRQQPGISPQAWEAASRKLSGEDRASAESAARQAEQAYRSDERLLADKDIRLRQQEIDSRAEQERIAAAEEREQARQDAIATRQHAAQGGATHTDPVTGRSTITRHEDGAPKFDAGAVGEPRVERTQQADLASIPGMGAAITLGSPIKTHQGVQDFRDDRGDVATLPIEEKTDPATGETYVETKDQFGRPKRLTTGTDQKVKRTLQLGLEYDQIQATRSNLEIQAQQIAPNYQAAADAFAAAQRKYNVAPKYIQVAGKWVENGVIPADPDEQRKWVQTQIPADPIKLAAWQRERQMDRQAYEIAKRNHDKAAPAWNNLQQQIETAKSREAQIRVAKKRLALGLPEDDGGLAESLVALENGTVTTREQAVNAYLADLPADTRARLARGLDPKIAAQESPAPAGNQVFPTRHPHAKNPDGSSSNVLLAGINIDGKERVIPTMIDGKKLSVDKAAEIAISNGIDNYPTFNTPEEASAWAEKNHGNIDESGRLIETATEIPAIPQDNPAAVELFKSAFAPIPGAESLTIGETGKTYRTLHRDGQTIGAIYTDPENPERPFIALSAYAGSDLAPRVNLDAADGLRVYLQENIRNRPSPTKEDAWAAGVYATLLDPALKQDEQAQNEYLRQQQATPTDLINRVRQGEVSVQVGSRMLRDLYGIELATGDYNDPALFQKWLQEESARRLREDAWLPQDTVAAKWQRATKDRLSFSEQENIRNDYAAHYALTNPLLTRDQQKALYAQNARHDASTMDRVRSFVNATKKFAAEDVFGSSIGIVAGIGEDLSYAGASALSESARETLAEKMRLRGMSTAAWAQGVERFAKTLATKEGRDAAAQRDLAMREWQAAVDAAHGQPEPDQAAIDAAKQKAIAATLRLHNLARDESSPIEAHHLDPAQDRALRMAMDRYVATADPRAWASLDDRMLMSNDRRWVSAEMEELAGGQGGFLGAVNRARYAGFEEVGSEALTWLTLGAYGAAIKGGKALNAAMKGIRAYQASRIGKIGGSISTSLQKAAVNFDNLGKAAGTLQKPLTTGQRMGNATLRGAKIGVIGGGTEGLEEVFVELGADDPQLLKTFALGAAGGVMMLPIGAVQAGIGGAVASHQQQARFQQQYAAYAREYNRINRDIPGFEPIDPKTAEFASLFVNPQEREAGLQQLGAEMAGIQEFLAAENSAQAAGQTPGPEVAAMEQRLQSLEAVSTTLAEMDVAAIDAVAGFSKLDAQEKTNLVAYAKAAAGRAELLTPQERRAIQAKNTAAGAPVFQGDAVTPEGMAMLVEQYPVLGKLPQFQEAISQSTPVEAIDQSIAMAAGMEGPNATRFPIDEATTARARSITQSFMQAVAAKSPALAQRMAIVPPNPNAVTGGLELDIEGGTIHVIEEDVARHIAINPDATDAQLVDYFTEMAYTHETVHAAQAAHVDNESAARGLTGSRGDNFRVIYTELAEQYRTESPQAWGMAAELYARNSTDPQAAMAAWTNMQPFQQAAEMERMFIEGILKGEATDPQRIMDAALGKLKERLLMLARQIGEWIKTGRITTADGTVLELPETIKARAQEIAKIVENIRQGTNATPNPNPSRPNPADNPSQPAPGQPGAGNRQSAEKDGNRRPPGDGRTGQTPVDDAGASAQSAEEIAQAAAKAEYDLALKARPLLKKDLELMSALRIAAMEARVAATADPQNATRIAKDAIGKFLQDPYVSERLGSMEMENRAKAKEYRRQAMARVNAEADRIIAGIDLIRTLLGYVGRIEGKPANLGLIRQKRDAAKKDPNITLTPEEQAIADKYLTGNYDQMPTVGDFPGSGKNAVAAAIVRKIFTEPGSGVEPDVAASAKDMAKFNLQSGNDLMVAIADALRNYVNGTEASDLADPNADTSGMTDEQIEAMLQREARAQNLSRWKGVTRREGLTSSTADAYQAELATLADAAGHSLDEGGNVVDAFGDFIPPEDLAALQQQAIDAVDERLEAEAEARRPKTPAQTAAMNSRVEELTRPMEGGLVAAEAVLDPTPLTAAQNHLPGLTRVRQTPLVQRALALAERIIPYFQGNKLKMTGPVVSSQEQYSTAEQRAAVHTMYDLFGGGGAWGIVLAESLYPNLRTLHINEFDRTRAIKIKAQVEYGDQFAAIVNSPEVRHALAAMIAAHRQRPAVQAKIAKQMAAQQQGDFIAPQNLTPEEIAEMNEAWSWGVINKTAAQYAKSLDTTTQDRVIAVLKTMADDPERSGPWFKSNPDAEPTVDELVAWFTDRHAPKAAAIKQTADRMKARGVDFQFHQGDAYAMEIERGPGVAVVADPPYFATTGYDEVNQKQVVNTDIYRRSAKLMADLVANDNHVIYTDEAWWLRKNIDNAIRPADLVEGQKIAEGIGNTLDFTVVAEQIDSRYETLGLHNPAGSPVAASRSASRSRDLRGDNQGRGDGGGNQRGGGTAPLEIPPRTDDQAGLQPSGNPATPAGEDLTRLGSAPATPRIRRSIGELEALAKSQEDFRFWFQDFRGFLEDFLGPNKDYAPLVSEFLNATSAASTVGSNVVAMMKALREYIETGTFVSDFLPAHLGNLHRAQSGQILSGPKISEYSDAIFGIETAVPVDRHIAQLLFNTEKPTAAQIRAAKIRVAKVGLRLGWTPRQTMATLWAANIARSGRTPQSYERYLQKYRFEIRRLLSADRQGNQRGLKASRRIAARIEQRRSDERTTDGRDTGSTTLGSAPATGRNGRPAVQTQDGRTLEAPGPVTLMSPAYHGTPHKIDPREGFRLDRIGTGEGAQAYGWGLYFAQDRRVGEQYRDDLSRKHRKTVIKVGNEEWSTQDVINEFTDAEDRLLRDIAKELEYEVSHGRQPDLDAAIKLLRDGAAIDRNAARVALIDSLVDRGISPVTLPSDNPGNLYKVDLKPAEDEYLDWDKPLSEQSEKVLAAIRRIPADLAIDLLDAPGFYKNEAVVWARKMGWIDAGITNPEGASRYLRALGIRGIRYLDADSRSIGAGKYNVRWENNDPVNGERAEVYEKATGQVVGVFDTFREADAWVMANQEASYNYVIFDEADIEITEVNGQPVDAASLFSAPATAPDMRPLTPGRLWGEWAASATEPGILIGYRGERGNGQADNGFGSSEGVGLYLAKTEEDTAFFGKAREVKFPKPKRPLIVDEQAGVEALPLLDEESPVWSRIFSHQPRPGDSDWIKAHTLAAKQIGLTEDTWVDKIDLFPRALTDKLLAMGYDAVYTRSGGMEWVTLLAKPGQRFNRGTRSERGTALYSAPALAKSLLDSIGEQALRVEQPGKSYEGKRQLILDFSKSLLPAEGASSAVPDRPLGPVSLLRSRVAGAVASDLRVKFIGETIEGLEDLVEKAQVLRNPGFETFYLLATRIENGKAKVLDAMVVTSRVPLSSAIFERNKSWDEGAADHVAFLRNAGADSYILLHNHPAGDPSPSAADIRVTREHARRMDAEGFELIDHVVINHLTYATLDANGIVSRGQIQSDAVDPYPWPVGTEIGMEGDGPVKIAAIAKNIQEAKDRPDLLVGFFLNSDLKIVASVQGSAQDIKKLTRSQLQEIGRRQGGHMFVLHGQAANRQEAMRLMRELAPMNQSGLLTDAIIELRDSDQFLSGEDTSFFRQSEDGIFPDKTPGERVQQTPAAQYRYLKAKQEKAGLTPAEEQALLRAEQAMGQSFAIDMDDPSLRARKGSVSPAFQPQLNLETQHPITGRQLALFSAPASRITSDMDAYYMESVKNGDMETAQMLVHQASFYAMGDPHWALRENNGDRMKMYHGSGHSDHTVFSLEGTPHGGKIRPERVGRGIDKLGFWFTSSESQGRAFSFVPGKGHGKTYSVYLDIRNPLVLRSIKEWNDWVEKYALHHGNDAQMEIALEKGGRYPAGWFNAEMVRERLRLGGKDGIVVIDSDLDGRFGLEEGEGFPTWAIALSPSQIKSADPVTYDAQGNVIPLSQRFNPDSDSILYSAPAQNPLAEQYLKTVRKEDIDVDVESILMNVMEQAYQKKLDESDDNIRQLIQNDVDDYYAEGDDEALIPDSDGDPAFWEPGPAKAELYERVLQSKTAITALRKLALAQLESDDPGPAYDLAWRAVESAMLVPRMAKPAATLASPPTQPDDQAATEAALRGLDPIYGDVLKASQESPTPTPEALADRFNLPVRAIHNIIGTVRTRIQAQGRTIRPGGLQPQRTADGRLKGGMPQRGNSTVPHLAAVDQLQQQEGLPLSKTNREIHDAGRRLAARPDALDHLLAAQRSGAPTAEQIAATAHYLREASVRGDQSAKLTELAILYREQGTRQSEEFRARIDQYHTPSERNALIFQEMLTAPNKKVRKAYDDAKTPEAKLAILEAWNAKVKGIKETMKSRGIDLDAALARLAEQRANVQAGEAYASEAHQKLVDSLNAEVAPLRQQLAAAQEGPARDAAQAKLDAAEQNAAKAAELDPRNTIRLELEKLRPDERAVIETLRETQDWATAAARGFMDIREVKRLVDRFQDAIATAGMQAILLAEDILLDRQATLQAPAANAPDRVKEAYRMAMAMTKVATGIDPDAINRKAAGKPPKSTRQKKADAGPEPAMMTDEQFAAYQNNPQTWRPLWQAEAALTGQRLTFEEWQAKPETQALKQRQERMFKQPISTTTGELDMHDPVSVKRAYNAINSRNASLFDKAAEYWRMGILTGPQTAIVNFGGNIAHSLYQLGPRRILEAGVNDVLGIIGMGSKDAATLGELRVMSRQIHRALQKAGTDMIRSWNHDDRIVENEVLALGQQLDFAGGTGADTHTRVTEGWYSDFMHAASFRHMTAADEFLKSFHGHVEVAAIAYRMAKKEGLKGDAMEARIDELMVYGSPAWVKAYESAEWVTFQTRPDKDDKRSLAFLDRAAKAIRRYTMSDTGRTKEVPYVTRDGKLGKRVVPILKPNAFVFFFPFINTPLNIFKIGIEMSPIGALFSLVDATRALKTRLDSGHLTPELAKAEAAELYNKRRLVADLTNQIIGAGLFWALGALVKPDDEDELPFITGSVDWKRTSRGDRDVRQRVMPAYSIRIGDAIFSYQRVEPFGTALGFLVDARLAVDKHGGISDEALGEFMTTAINQMDNKTYLQGVSDLFNLWHDPSRFGTKVTGNIVTGFVPNLIRQPIRETDPYIRDTRPAAEDGFMEAVGKRLGYSLAPGYAPPMLDVWGNPLQRNPGAKLLGSPITDIPLRVFDPTHLTIGKEIDPIDRYIFNWNNSQADQKARFNIEPIQDTLVISRNGTSHKVAISQEDHLQANRNAGQAARAVLGNDWNPVQPTEQGIERIKDVVRTFQKRERDRLRAKYAATLPAE